MWKCTQCQEDVEDNFDCCWKCGADEKGRVNPNFVTADSARVSQPVMIEKRVPRFRLRSLVISVTCLCVIFAVIRTAAAPILVFAACMTLVPVFMLHFYVFLYGILATLIGRYYARDNDSTRYRRTT